MVGVISATVVGGVLSAAFGASYASNPAIDRLVFVAVAGSVISALYARVGGASWSWAYAWVAYVSAAATLLAGPLLVQAVREYVPFGTEVVRSDAGVVVAFGLAAWISILALTVGLLSLRRIRGMPT
jgi:hypothetical protein